MSPSCFTTPVGERQRETERGEVGQTDRDSAALADGVTGDLTKQTDSLFVHFLVAFGFVGLRGSTGTTGGEHFLSLLRFKDLEGAHERFIDGHHRSGIVEFTTIVRGREDRHQTPLRKELVSVLHNLMRSANEVEIVFFEELCDDITAERERNAAIVLTPTLNVLIRIAP